LKILGKSFYLRPLLKKDLSEEYFSWLKDREVNQFLDVRFSVPDRKKAETNLEKYDNKKSFFFGVFDKKNDKFIGTTTLQIDTINKIAYYGYLIGDKNYWGTNAGIDTIALLMDFGFENFDINKIWGGTLITNIGSIFNFKKLGFVQEGRLREHAIIDGKKIDRVVFGLLKKEWLEKRKKFNYQDI
tara:strand:+ start:809 stop:1366 length:558 start_codon:yes stop_codon:yes gene_type:complete